MLHNEKEFCGEWVVHGLGSRASKCFTFCFFEVFYHSYSSAAMGSAKTALRGSQIGAEALLYEVQAAVVCNPEGRMV